MTHTMQNPIHEAIAEHRRVLAEREELTKALQRILGRHAAHNYKRADDMAAIARAALSKVAP